MSDNLIKKACILFKKLYYLIILFILCHVALNEVIIERVKRKRKDMKKKKMSYGTRAVREGEIGRIRDPKTGRKARQTDTALLAR